MLSTFSEAEEMIALQWMPGGEKKDRPQNTSRRMAKREMNNMGWRSREIVTRAAADRQKWND